MTRFTHTPLIAAVSSCLVSAFAAAALPTTAFADEPLPFLPHISITSTIPANGDLNPYGVAFVPSDFPQGGPLAPGDILVSNFNDSGNGQGTGTTIIQFRPNVAVTPGVPAGQAGNATAFFKARVSG